MSRAGSWVDPHSDARLVVQTWLGTRLLMGLVAVWLMSTEHRGLKDLFGNWDVAHFVAIAENGYADRRDIAFFPGWPLLLRIASMTGMSTLLVGTLLALLASGFAAAALYRIGGAPTAIAWLLAPTAVFTMVPPSPCSALPRSGRGSGQRRSNGARQRCWRRSLPPSGCPGCS